MLSARSWLNKVPTEVRIISVYGAVLLTISEDLPAIALEKDMMLEMTAEVKTGANSGVQFEFDDGSKVTLKAGSLLRFKRLYRYGSTSIRDTQLFLQQGRVKNEVQPLSGSTSRFEVVTPLAITGVRGTKFRINSDHVTATTWVEVLEGSVAVSSGDEDVTVFSGFGTLAVSGQAPVIAKPLMQAPDLGTIPVEHKGDITFALPIMKAANSFCVQLSNIKDVQTLLLDEVFYGETVRIENLPEGEYLLTVQAIGLSGFEGRSSSTSITLSADSNWLYGLLILGGILIVLL